MTKTSWTDIDRQGRGMAAIVEWCKTTIKKMQKEEDINYDAIMGIIDRQIKASQHQAKLIDMNLKLNMLFRLAEKKHSDEILDISLKELVDKKK